MPTEFLDSNQVLAESATRLMHTGVPSGNTLKPDSTSASDTPYTASRNAACALSTQLGPDRVADVHAARVSLTREAPKYTTASD